MAEYTENLDLILPDKKETYDVEKIPREKFIYKRFY